MNTTAASRSPGGLLAILAFVVADLAAIAALVAGPLYAENLLELRQAFLLLRWAFFGAAAAGVLALLLVVAKRALKWDTPMGLLLAAFLVALATAVALYGLYRNARSVPPIHDVTTDLDDPPAFTVLKPRADEAEPRVPAGGRADLAPLSPRERWRVYHEEAYGDLKPLVLSGSVEDVTRLAERVARAMGWQIALSDPAAGRLEATATTRWFRFKDDVAVRVTPLDGEPGRVRVDVRSVSRIGISDLGANAKRIRAFLAALQKAAERS
ncbi:MAG: hypothetical protein KatS3mg119_2064 [Rhodothalassiaceae bacterium]|nr:MAG: hypothetical protein KatS3mg119_2064 [Rhodothalassiaceae bacterium]